MEDWSGGGLAAFQRGDYSTAREALEKVIAAHPLAAAHELLAYACMVLEDVDAGRRHGETAYRLYRQAGDACRAASTAVIVAQIHDWLGNDAAVRGWLARAARLLDEVGPCVERGYLELAMAGCEVRDATALEGSAKRALELARQFRDPDLEARALADWGLALVCQGKVDEGLALLDEAMAAVVGGEVGKHGVAGLTCCSMLTACERLGDLDRALQWTEAVRATARDRFGDPPAQVLYSHCRLVYGGLLSEAGRWQEAEAEYRRAIELTQCVPKRAAARGGIAELYIDQGRLAEAEQLLSGWEDRAEVARAIARLHLARGELDLAAATLGRWLGEFATDLLTTAPLLALHVEVEVRRGRLEQASASASRLTSIAEQMQIPSLSALAQLMAASVTAASGEDAVPELRAALAPLGDGSRPRLRGQIHLELARALASKDRAAAILEARCAMAIFERIGARTKCDEAASLLRRLGVSVRTGGAAGTILDSLSQRERDVLPLLAEGLTNAQIGARLFITPKTAEHHVGSILGKLGLKTRAEAAAYAAGKVKKNASAA